MTKLHTLALGLVCSFTTICFAEESVIRKELPKNVPQIKEVDRVATTPIAGLFEVTFNGGEVVYTDAKASYLFQGALIDVKNKRNLTQEYVAKLRVVDFAMLPIADAITIVRGNGTRKLAVFEDPNCGYCKKFEQDIQKVDDVTVYLFLYPVLGQDSKNKSTQVWCSKDRASAWLDLMVREKPLNVPIDSCDVSAIERNSAFARKAKISGTPTLIFASGKRIPGAIPADQIERELAVVK